MFSFFPYFSSYYLILALLLIFSIPILYFSLPNVILSFYINLFTIDFIIQEVMNKECFIFIVLFSYIFLYFISIQIIMNIFISFNDFILSIIFLYPQKLICCYCLHYPFSVSFMKR